MVAEFLYSFESTLNMEQPTTTAIATASGSPTAPAADEETSSAMDVDGNHDKAAATATATTPPAATTTTATTNMTTGTPHRDTHETAIMERVLLALLDPCSTLRYREILVQLLKPLVIVTYKPGNFETILSSVRAATPTVAAAASTTTTTAEDPSTDHDEPMFVLANVSNPQLAPSLGIDSCSVTELLLMYIKDNVGAFQQFMSSGRRRA